MVMIFFLMGIILLVGAPLAVGFGLPIFFSLDKLGLSITSLSNIPYEEISAFSLIAIPLFMFTGGLMSASGMAKELIALSDLALGRIRGSFGYIAIAASALLGAITGSSVATVAAVGGIVSPEMIRRGYPGGYVASLTATAGLLGVLLPPSIPLILYGATVGVSVSQLFTATLLPAALMAGLFLLVHVFLSRRLLPNGVEQRTSDVDAPPAKEQVASWRMMGRVGSVLLLPVIILGGIYGGIMTPTEAAAVGCLYAVVVVVLRRMVGHKVMTGALRDAVITGAGILFVIALTGVFNRAMVLEFTGFPGAFNEGLDLVRKGGRYLTVGQLGAGATTFSPSLIVKKNIRVIGSFSGDVKSYWKALQFASAHIDHIPFRKMISGTYRLADVNVALEKMHRLEEIKPLILME